MEEGELGIAVNIEGIDEIGMLGRRYNSMSQSILRLMKQNEAAQEEKLQVEMQFLRAQINPHFIYNTLNNIKWMAVIKKADNIVESITALSEILQPIFRNSDYVCTLQEEIEYTKDYIKVMNFRFAGAIQLEIELPEALKSCIVLRFLLQPLVENSIFHGFPETGGILRIIASREGDDLQILIEDNGIGMEPERLALINQAISASAHMEYQGRIGVENVVRRVRLHYGEDYEGILVESEPGQGTRIRIRVPLRYADGMNP